MTNAFFRSLLINSDNFTIFISVPVGAFKAVGRNIYIFFSMENLDFGFRNLTTGYETFYPSHAFITILTPLFNEIAIPKTPIENDRIQLCINERMIDELTEVGDYTIVIDLYDEYEDSLLTLPPIENQLKVRDRITSLNKDY